MAHPKTRSIVQLLSSIVLTAAVILAGAFAGQQYTYCRTMERVMAAGCDCDPGRRSSDVDLLSRRDTPVVRTATGAPCFELRRFDGFVSERASSAAPAPLAPPLLVPAPAYRISFPIAAPRIVFAEERPIRAGPFSPMAARARLMVYLT